MMTTQRKRVLSLVLCLVLTWTAALITGCKDKTNEPPDAGSPAVSTTAESADSTETSAETDTSDAVKLGEGKTAFTFTVTDGEGKETVFGISTDKTTVGEALLELGLIEGDAGPYGLYVKKVNGITADYDTSGTYWAFYVNGEYGMTGVDSTNIEDGATYSFKVEK